MAGFKRDFLTTVFKKRKEDETKKKNCSKSFDWLEMKTAFLLLLLPLLLLSTFFEYGSRVLREDRKLFLARSMPQLSRLLPKCGQNIQNSLMLRNLN